MAALALGICLSPLAGCPSGEVPVGPLDWDAHIVSHTAVAATNAGTVVTVEWTTAGPTRGYVEYGTDEDLGQIRHFYGGAGAEHRLLLLGLRANTEYHYRLTATVDGEPASHTSGSFETAAVPPEVLSASIVSDVLHPEGASGGFVAMPLISTTSIPVIVDADGEPVWWHLDDEPHELTTGVTLSPDHRHVFYNSIYFDSDDAPVEQERIVRVSLDGSEVRYLDVPRHSHSFEVLEDGTVAYLAYDSRSVEDEQIRGDQIIEIHPNGSTEVIWSVWDHFEFDPDAEYDQGTGWTHANALDYEPDEDAYYVSLRNLSCIVQIDRATGDVAWVLGGEDGDFDFVVGSPFAEQHEFDRLADGILVFDNGDQEELSSRVIEYELDEVAGEVSARWAYVTNPVIYVSMGGDVSRLEDGNTLVTWSSAGRIDLVDPGGGRIWGLTTGLGTAVGFTVWYPSLYLD